MLYPQCVPASIAMPPPTGVVEPPDKVFDWLSDTGTALHLVGKNSLSARELAKIRTVTPVSLHTPNGVVTVNQAIDLFVKSLQTNITALVMEDSPNALSVGKLVKESGLEFSWLPEAPDRPFFVLRNGMVTDLTVRHDTPSLTSACRPKIPAASGEIAEGEPELLCEICDDGAGTEKFAFSQEVAADRADPELNGILEPSSDYMAANTDDASSGFVGPAAITDVDLKREAMSDIHQLDHFPKNPFCEICCMSKPVAFPARKKSEDERIIQTSAFGDYVLADHITTNRADNEGGEGEKVALMLIDEHTKYRDVYPAGTKAADANKLHLMDFMGNDTGKQCYSDSAKEIKNAVEACGMLNPTGTPHRPTSRGRIEVNVKASIEGARANLYQSGLEHKWWPQAIKHWNTVTNVNRRSILRTTLHGSDERARPSKARLFPLELKSPIVFRET